MVQFATLGAASLVALATIGVGAISQTAREEVRYGLCPTYELRADYKGAERALDVARRSLDSARNGGSLYAAGKLGMDMDPAALGRAEARLEAAVSAHARALAACRSYMAE